MNFLFLASDVVLCVSLFQPIIPKSPHLSSARESGSSHCCFHYENHNSNHSKTTRNTKGKCYHGKEWGIVPLSTRSQTTIPCCPNRTIPHFHHSARSSFIEPNLSPSGEIHIHHEHSHRSPEYHCLNHKVDQEEFKQQSPAWTQHSKPSFQPVTVSSSGMPKLNSSPIKTKPKIPQLNLNKLRRGQFSQTTSLPNIQTPKSTVRTQPGKSTVNSKSVKKKQ